MDAEVGAHLVRECITGLLKERGCLVVLVTHQTHWLHMCDHVVQMDDGGRVRTQGPPSGMPLPRGSNPSLTDLERAHVAGGKAAAARARRRARQRRRQGGGGRRRPRRRRRRPTAATRRSRRRRRRRPAARRRGRGRAGQRPRRRIIERGVVRRSVWTTYVRALGFTSVAWLVALYTLSQALTLGSSYWLTLWSADKFGSYASAPRASTLRSTRRSALGRLPNLASRRRRRHRHHPRGAPPPPRGDLGGDGVAHLLLRRHAARADPQSLLGRPAGGRHPASYDDAAVLPVRLPAPRHPRPRDHQQLVHHLRPRALGRRLLLRGAVLPPLVPRAPASRLDLKVAHLRRLLGGAQRLRHDPRVRRRLALRRRDVRALRLERPRVVRVGGRQSLARRPPRVPGQHHRRVVGAACDRDVPARGRVGLGRLRRRGDGGPHAVVRFIAHRLSELAHPRLHRTGDPNGVGRTPLPLLRTSGRGEQGRRRAAARRRPSGRGRARSSSIA